MSKRTPIKSSEKDPPEGGPRKRRHQRLIAARRDRARRALALYYDLGRADVRTALIDLLVDARHLAESSSERLDLVEVAEVAEDLYRTESTPPDEE